MIHEHSNLMNMKGSEIIYNAIEKLISITRAKISINKAENAKTDGQISITIGNKQALMDIEVKNEIRQETLSTTLDKMKSHKNDWLLISQYIPMPLKQYLKSEKINYLEAAGNCYIDNNELFIYINDQQVTESRAIHENKLWKTAGLKFLFAILRNQELLNSSYRNIAKVSNIALGTVGNLLQEMKKEGYLKEGIRDGKNILFLEQKRQLMLKWSELYNAVLKPKLYLGSFRFMKPDLVINWRDIKSNKFKWGEENSGALLTKYLSPEKFTMYTCEDKLYLMKDLNLVPDSHGLIAIYEQFWSDEPGTEIFDNLHSVPPLLAFAELVTSLDSRNRETAERIKAEYLE